MSSVFLPKSLSGSVERIDQFAELVKDVAALAPPVALAIVAYEDVEGVVAGVVVHTVTGCSTGRHGRPRHSTSGCGIRWAPRFATCPTETCKHSGSGVLSGG